jgi:hypothetical protein
MSREFGLDWKNHDSARMTGFIVALSEINRRDKDARAPRGADGRSEFR